MVQSHGLGTSTRTRCLVTLLAWCLGHPNGTRLDVCRYGCTCAICHVVGRDFGKHLVRCLLLGAQPTSTTRCLCIWRRSQTQRLCTHHGRWCCFGTDCLLRTCFALTRSHAHFGSARICRMRVFWRCGATLSPTLQLVSVDRRPTGPMPERRPQLCCSHGRWEWAFVLDGPRKHITHHSSPTRFDPVGHEHRGNRARECTGCLALAPDAAS